MNNEMGKLKVFLVLATVMLLTIICIVIAFVFPADTAERILSKIIIAIICVVGLTYGIKFKVNP